MKFQFNVSVNDQDYLEYNTFCMSRAPYGKKQFKNFRVSLTVIFAIAFLVTLFNGGISLESALGTIPLIVIFALFQIFFEKIFAWSLKAQIKNLKKHGKAAYSMESVMEFYEDYFIEITPENKSEVKYSAIERVSVVDNKMIYFHFNNILSYMLPLASFESKEQYENFLEFIKTKCEKVDIY